METEKRMSEENFVGKWSVTDVTEALKNQDEGDIQETVTALEQGDTAATDMLLSSPTVEGGASTTEVEIQRSGMMLMTITQSLQPNVPVTVGIEMTITWELDGGTLITQAVLDQIQAQGRISPDVDLTSEQTEEMTRQLPEIEANVVQNLKDNPQMNRVNKVKVLICGKRYFLTRADEGALMLHERV
ncbi:MAG: hypothetical protein KZQ95_07430 [Candidatus Thiodiazotropha sp. (ex Epidulcina cf. delphinae)]|nr:hypothetical protein [Candidatus Thiodiazotropha sp. (ex Epidulcina cf. delphinae)]